MKASRKYQGKDIEMLTTCLIIIENALKNQSFLVTKRSLWTVEFFENIKLRINKAISDYLGVDNALLMREATQLVTKIYAEAFSLISELKVQIEQDFKSDKARRDEILRQLGYSSFFKMVSKGDQEAFVQMLFQFNNSLSSTLKTEIISKGTSPETLESITQYADQLSEANVSQENFKTSKKADTSEAITEFNEIYDEVISIATIARNFYKGNPAMQDQFSYNKIRKKLNLSAK